MSNRVIRTLTLLLTLAFVIVADGYAHLSGRADSAAQSCEHRTDTAADEYNVVRTSIAAKPAITIRPIQPFQTSLILSRPICAANRAAPQHRPQSYLADVSPRILRI